MTHSKARWVQVAIEGEYWGYVFPDGRQGFTFTRQVFERAITNSPDAARRARPWWEPPGSRQAHVT